MQGREDSEITVLIVDDNNENRTILTSAFSKYYNVYEAGSIEKSIECLSAFPRVDLLILTIRSSGIDCYNILKWIKKFYNDKELLVVAIVDNDNEEEQIKAIENGVSDIICKPFNEKLLILKINTLMNKFMSRRLLNYKKLFKANSFEEMIDNKSGIYNRLTFVNIADRILQANKDKKYSIIRWDIDNFSLFNDKYGIEAGDEFLKSVGAFLDSYSKQSLGIVLYGRLHSDHFVLLVDRELFDVESFAFSLLKINIINRAELFTIYPRVGIYDIEDYGISIALMCDWALLAIRSIKLKYDKIYAWYNESMRESMIIEQMIKNDMNEAVSNKNFKVYFQPQFDHKTGNMIGVEALVRWIHPVNGMIMPGLFIPVFEKNGFIYKLDRYMWEEVCIRIRNWIDKGMDLVPVSVNVSRCDLLNDNLVEILTGLTKKYNIPTSMLRLEITESAFSKSTDELISKVEILKSKGFLFEIDDFGSGYSSLNALKDVPAKAIKLDLRFFKKNYNTQKAIVILEAIIRMAKALGMNIIAEGVETKEQADFLLSLGCGFIQGFYYERPIPEEDFYNKYLNNKLVLRDVFQKNKMEEQ